MTKLEEEIQKAITKSTSHYERMAEAAAQVARKYIEKAFDAGVDAMDGSVTVIRKQDWLKENGIV